MREKKKLLRKRTEGENVRYKEKKKDTRKERKRERQTDRKER